MRVWMEEGHSWIEAAVEAGSWRDFLEEVEEGDVGDREGRDDVSDLESAAGEKKGEFEGIGVEAGADGDGSRAREKDGVFQRQDCEASFLVKGSVIDFFADGLGERLILLVDAAGGIEAAEGDIRDAETLCHLFRGWDGFRMQDDVEVGLCHFLEVLFIGAGGNLADGTDAETMQDGEEFRIFRERGKIAKKIDGAGITVRRFPEEAADGLSYLYHRWMKAFAREGVHIAGTRGEVDDFFDAARDAFHVGAEQRVGAGRAEEEAGGSVGAAFYEKTGSLRDL